MFSLPEDMSVISGQMVGRVRLENTNNDVVNQPASFTEHRY